MLRSLQLRHRPLGRERQAREWPMSNGKRRRTYTHERNTTSISRLAGTVQAVATTMTYEPLFNQLASLTDPLGHTTQYIHDARGSQVGSGLNTVSLT